MNCPECGQSVPDIATRCPNCQAHTAAGFGSTLPPRASQRDSRARLTLHLSEITQGFERFFRTHGLPETWLSRRIERYLASPELWLSLILPGSGHIYLGRVILGGLLLAIATAFLIGLVLLFGDEFITNVNSHLLLFGLFLGIVHMHVWSLGSRMRPGSGGTLPRGTATVLIMVVVAMQFTLVETVMRRQFFGLADQIYIRGQAFWAPVLMPNDLLVIQAAPAGDIARGDLLMISRTICERVLGIANDIVELKAGRITCNDLPLIGTHSQPLMEWGTAYVPDGANRHYAIDHQRTAVPQGHIAYLWWGREIRTVAVTETHGRIVGISAPPERRCRFENGRPLPYPQRTFTRYLWGW